MSSGAKSGRPQILVCDDEQQILRALRVILRDAGFEALPASTHLELDCGHVPQLEAPVQTHRALLQFLAA